MDFRRLTSPAALVVAGLLAGCVGTYTPTTQVRTMSVEEQKIDIARQRDAGRIGYAEAVRRQYAIQRANYALTPGEETFWQVSAREAARVDAREITPAEYQRRVREAYARYGRPR